MFSSEFCEEHPFLQNDSSECICIELIKDDT